MKNKMKAMTGPALNFLLVNIMKKTLKMAILEMTLENFPEEKKEEPSTFGWDAFIKRKGKNCSGINHPAPTWFV